MDHEQLQRVLEEARDRFLKAEKYLLAADVNERSLTHKFAEHLQAIVGGEWSVDCEYNRYGDDTKTIDYVLQIVGESVSTASTKARTVYPDIIIHRRGAKGPNLLVIEAKKDASKEEYHSDWEKLKKIQKEYEYTFAAFVNFLTAEHKITFALRE